MTFGSGLDAQIGMKKETTFNTAVTVDRFYEFNSAAIEPEVVSIEPIPLGRGRMLRSGRSRTYAKGAAGDIEIDAVNRGLGVLLEQMFGTVATAQVGETAEYTHTFTPNANGKRALSATVQVGVPATTGTVHPFTYAGGKVTAWSMTAALDEVLKINTTWDFSSAVTSTALASASYATAPVPFTFLDGTLTLGGDAVAAVKGLSLEAVEAMDTGREYFGNTRGEPLANGELAYTGTIESEFSSLTAYAAYVAGTELATLVLTFTGAVIPDIANPYKIVVTIPALKYTGTGPTVSGPEIVPQNLPFKALNNGSDEIITLVYHTDDTAV